MSTSTNPVLPSKSKPAKPLNHADLPNLHLHSTATLSPRARILGTHSVTIAAHTVVHPFATLDVTNGPLVLGKACVVWEQVVICAPAAGTTLADAVQLHPAAYVAATHIGQGSIVGAAARTGTRARLGSNVTIAPRGVVDDDALVPASTAVFRLHGLMTSRKTHHTDQHTGTLLAI